MPHVKTKFYFIKKVPKSKKFKKKKKNTKKYGQGWQSRLSIPASGAGHCTPQRWGVSPASKVVDSTATPNGWNGLLGRSQQKGWLAQPPPTEGVLT
jgi:hypothetical protein